jgi:hypothetical protein
LERVRQGEGVAKDFFRRDVWSRNLSGDLDIQDHPWADYTDIAVAAL